MLKKSIVFSIFLTLLVVGFASGADKYKIDVTHSFIGFSVKHLVISNTKGQFKDFSADFILDENDITNSSVTITINVASIDTDDEKRDNHLRSADFFDVENHPTITFKSTSIEDKEDGFVAVGDLTIRGVTKEVTMSFTITGPVEALGGKRFGAEANLTINRHDFGVSWSKTLDSGGLIVGNYVKISLEVEAIKTDEGTN